LPDEASLPHAGQFYQALWGLKADLHIAEFLETLFAGPRYNELRRSVTRTIGGYDAADPHYASTLTLREEWVGRDRVSIDASRRAMARRSSISYRHTVGSMPRSIWARSCRDGDRRGCRQIAVHCNEGAILAPMP